MIVFDASALLALVFAETGAEKVRSALGQESGICSSVNWSEIAQKVHSLNGSWDTTRAALLGLGLVIEPVNQADAEAAALLWAPKDGLSLADRICLAVGQRLGTKVLTADRAWVDRPGVELIR